MSKENRTALQEVLDIEHEWVQAIKSRDIPTMERILANEYTMHRGGSWLQTSPNQFQVKKHLQPLDSPATGGCILMQNALER
jgi:hypothetical protein